MGKKHKMRLHDIPDAEHRDAVKNIGSIHQHKGERECLVQPYLT
jgi:hypothetical protein